MQEVRKVDGESGHDALRLASALVIFGESVRFLGCANAMALSLEVTRDVRAAHAVLSGMGAELATRMRSAHAANSATFAILNEAIALARTLPNPFVACIERAVANENEFRQRIRRLADEL